MRRAYVDYVRITADTMVQRVEIKRLSHFLAFLQQRLQRLHSNHVTAKIEVPWKRTALAVKWVVTAWEHQLDRLWREGLRPRALVNLEGDSTQ